MPTIAVDKYELFKALEKGKGYTSDEFQTLCFEYGIELDEDTEEEQRPIVDGKQEPPQLKIEVGANRYDLLCFEGIALNLRVFTGLQSFPKYKLANIAEKDMQITTIHESTAAVRPYFSCAILRGIKFTKERYASFIALQDKLHSNLARNRSLVAIGTHDLSTLTGPFEYRADPPSKIKFVPLNQNRAVSGEEFIDFYSKEKHLSRYLPLIKDKPSPDAPLYPIIRDSKGTVLSLPPIINSNHSKITLDTRDVYIDITGTDKTKVEIVNHILCAMFSLYCSEPFTIEPVRLLSKHNGESRITPSLIPSVMEASVSYLNSCTGLTLAPAEQAKLLAKMGLEAEPSKKDKDVLEVTIPITRPDILHVADIMEDYAVAYGFNRLPRYYPNTSTTVSAPLPINKVADIVRLECAMAGWTEALPLILCSHEENFAWLNRKDDGKTAIRLANPKSIEYQVVRTSLLPGLLKTIRENKHRPVPLKVFEVSDVAFKAPELERKTRNERHFAAVWYGKTSGFEVVHGLMDRILQMLDFKFRETLKSDQKANQYWIEELDDPTFFHGHAASIHILIDGKEHVIGSLGVLHPSVLKNFELPYVVSALEINVEFFL